MLHIVDVITICGVFCFFEVENIRIKGRGDMVRVECKKMKELERWGGNDDRMYDKMLFCGKK